MNIKTRIEKLEKEMEPKDKELIVYIQNFSAVESLPGHEPDPLPDPEKEIERQRAEGKRLIVVTVPYGYVPGGGYTV
jgi:hypothetical protein